MTNAPTAARTAPQASDQYVQSLARGLAVIRAFDHDHPVMTLTEVAARTDLTRATARRFLHTLVELDYVRTDGKTFALTATQPPKPPHFCYLAPCPRFGAGA
jgi:IclR family pca regulon transcriptional regulator